MSREIVKSNLRKHLNPAIKGKKTDAVLEALSYPLSNLVHNIEAVNDMIYIVTAEEQYLDQLLAARGLRRPENLGLSDDIFREIGIEVSNRKQVRSLINNLLRIVYESDYVNANIDSNFNEPYYLEDGDTLKIIFDDNEEAEVVFVSSQFQNINAATAQEVADAITKELRRLGMSGSATIVSDGTSNKVRIFSQTVGPSSSVKVVGGKAQNSLRFDYLVPTGGMPLTQWTVQTQPNGNVRMTWTGGPNPSIGLVRAGDYVNVYGNAFFPENKGTFTVLNVKSGIVGEAYVEFKNPISINQIALQASNDGVLFFRPVRKTLNNKVAFAASYQTESRLLEIFLPATTKVVRRGNIGAAHLHDTGPSVEEHKGPYVWDLSKGFLIGEEECHTTQAIDSNSNFVISVDDSSSIPDDQGYLIFGFGTDKEEGPVPYIGRPSSTSIVLNPSYNFKFVHPAGTNISYVTQNFAYIPSNDGSDYPFYVTDVVSGRIYSEELINLVKATGIKIVFNIMYSNDIGLGKWGTPSSEIVDVFGPDKE